MAKKRTRLTRVIRKTRKRRRKKAKTKPLRLQPVDAALLVFIGRRDLLSSAQQRLFT